MNPQETKKAWWRIFWERSKETLDRDASKREPNPQRDWIILLSLFAVGIALSALLAAYEFFSVSDSGRHAPLPAEHAGTINERTLDATLSVYKARKQEFDALMQNATTSVADPSL